jgi:16S rRNA (uracil1498-N3)-methyltransferase
MNVDRLFYLEELGEQSSLITLSEETAKHVIQVLRMKKGDALFFTDGKGRTAKSIIVDDHKKRPQVEIVSITASDAPPAQFAIAIALTKNAGRFEWFLEKATEIGIQQIIPLKTHRTEKQHFRFERMNNILVSAMLQSQQNYLPQLWEPVHLAELCENDWVKNEPHKYIAHCIDSEKNAFSDRLYQDQKSGLILIGPEGDFTEEEIQMALEHHFQPVSLGEHRLRTETAGMVAATLMMIGRTK